MYLYVYRREPNITFRKMCVHCTVPLEISQSIGIIILLLMVYWWSSYDPEDLELKIYASTKGASIISENQLADPLKYIDIVEKTCLSFLGAAAPLQSTLYTLYICVYIHIVSHNWVILQSIHSKQKYKNFLFKKDIQKSSLFLYKSWFSKISSTICQSIHLTLI